MNPDTLTNTGTLENIFWFCAIGGTVFFVIRFGMLLLGASHGDGGDFQDVDMHGGDLHGDGHDGSGSDAHFSVLSINSITAFIMMFGWAGLTSYKQFTLGVIASALIALIVGVLCMFFTAYLFQAARKLVSKGTVFKIEDSVGKKASVYQRIPEQGKGRINLSVPGSNTRELDALSEDKKVIDSFKTVEIVKVVDHQTVSVREVD